jgi:hypothetical protein
MQGQKQGLSKFKNCSPQQQPPEKCKFCRMNCGGKCVYTHEQVSEDEEELPLDLSCNSHRKG